MQNAPRDHSTIFSTFIKLQFVFKTFVLSIFEWPLKTGFTVYRVHEIYLFCLFDLILKSQSTILQLCWDGSPWIEPVLSKDKCVLLKDITQ